MRKSVSNRLHLLARIVGVGCLAGSWASASRTYRGLRTCVEHADREAVLEMCNQFDSSIDGDLRVMVLGLMLFFVSQMKLRAHARAFRSWFSRPA
jgi:hypothetical protein